MRIKQSICYPLFMPPGMSIDELCRAASDIGYAAIEFWHPDASHEQVIATAQSYGLAIASMSGHYALEDGLNNRDNHDRIEEELIESIGYAAKAEIGGLICFSGNCIEGQPEQDAIEACVQCLKKVAPYAEEKGVNLNLELLNSKVDHPGYQCDHSAWGIAVCEKVGSPNVKVLYDIYHMQIMEGDIIRTIRRHIGRIGHFHTAGNPGRNEINDEQELHYPGICKAIAATDYRGYVGHELKPLGDPVAALRSAFAACDQGA